MNDDFQSRLDCVRERIADACKRAGRSIDDVSLLAVAKTFGPEQVQEAVDCGLSVIGESKVQEARHKILLCSGNIEWHMIGHLQTNKVKEAVRLFKMIHAVDSLKLLEAINGACGAAGEVMKVCLEVNVSGERSKFGMKPEDLAVLLEQSTRMMNIEVVGLMTIPPYSEKVEESRSFFAALRELRDKCRREYNVSLVDLSMGMSGDFEIAIEEGATWIRLGSVLFGDRPPRKQINIGDVEGDI